MAKGDGTDVEGRAGKKTERCGQATSRGEGREDGVPGTGGQGRGRTKCRRHRTQRMKAEQGRGGRERWDAGRTRAGRARQEREKENGIRIEGGGRGGQTEDGQMEGMGEPDGREGGRWRKEPPREGGQGGEQWGGGVRGGRGGEGG